MVLAGELHPQRHHDAGDVAAAEDGVAVCQRKQLGDRVGLLRGGLADLAQPVLVDPLEHGEREVLLVVELVIQRAARVTGLARDLLEHEVAVAVAREAARGGFEQRAARACAALSLSGRSARGQRRCSDGAHRPFALRLARSNIHTRMYDSVPADRRMSTASPQHSDLSPSRDRRAAAPTVRWSRQVPDAIRALGALADADYADIVTATLDEVPEGTTEQLIRATLKNVPRGLLLLTPFVQRVFLGLRLQLRASPDHLLGWKIADRGETWVRIEASSWFLTGHVVMQLDRGELSFASFIRYDRRLAAFVWPPVSLIHRQVALALVRAATRVR